MNDYAEYLSLLKNISHTLSVLTEIAHKKTESVRRDELAQLNDCIKKEQALNLSLRGYEQRRQTLLANLGLAGTKLSALPEHYPPKLQREANQTVEALQREYQIYRSAAEVARSTLECNLHQIEKLLAQSNPEPGPGYTRHDPELPPSMKTDFRA